MTGTESVMTLSNGDKFFGEFVNGKLNGLGEIFYFKSGDKLKGMFKNNKLNGQGEFFKGKMRYVG